MTQSPEIGSTQTGNFTVTLTANDEAGNTDECTVGVTVTEIIPPSIGCPAAQTANYDADCELSTPNYTALAYTPLNLPPLYPVTLTPDTG